MRERPKHARQRFAGRPISKDAGYAAHGWSASRDAVIALATATDPMLVDHHLLAQLGAALDGRVASMTSVAKLTAGQTPMRSVMMMSAGVGRHMMPVTASMRCG